jgi:hypothetical protein
VFRGKPIKLWPTQTFMGEELVRKKVENRPAAFLMNPMADQKRAAADNRSG